MISRPMKRLRSWVSGLGQPGRIEIVLSVMLAAVILLAEIPVNRTTFLGLDLLVCLAAGATARWPRGAGAALAIVGSLYLWLPNGAATMGEYAFLIPVLGTGMRGLFATRRALTAAYLAVMCGFVWNHTGTVLPAVVGSLVWAAMFAFAWLIGNVFHSYAEALQQARAAELVLQRQVLARELHDTVARSFTKVSMIAERAQLHGGASAADLGAISREAGKGVDELRWVMTLLSDPASSIEAMAAGTSLTAALSSFQEDLRAEGFQLSLSVSGDLEQLSLAQSAALAAITAEAGANIIKHADREYPCAVMVRVEDGVADLAFLNTPAESAGPDGEVKHLGLWGMRQRLLGLGGELSAEVADGLWVTRVTLPIGGRPAVGESDRDE